MLLKFKVENYRSFNCPLEIDFTRVHDYKFSTTALTRGLIGKLLVYGRNGSGKSNLGFALFDIVATLTDKNIVPLTHDDHGYLNADSDDPYAKFEYHLRFDDDILVYKYQKSALYQMVSESLFLNDQEVYQYDFKQRVGRFLNMNLIGADHLTFDYFDGNLAVLRYVAYNTSQSEDSLVKKLMDFVTHMLWFRSVQANEYIGFANGSENVEDWIINHSVVKDFAQFLKDKGKIELDLDTVEVSGTNMTRRQILVEKHKKNQLIFPIVASSGTKALELLFYWSRFFKEVSFLFIDEFDAYYHQELAINVMKLIYGFNHLQSICTTHNSSLANNSYTRPDCCFMLENGQLKSFAKASKRELREGHNLEKLLRSGEFNES